MRLLVTGGAGFIGSHYVRSVLADAWGGPRPISVTVLDKFTYAGNPENLAQVRDDPRLQVVRGDIVDSTNVEPLVTEADVVVHFAAESHVDRSITDGRDFVMTNVVGTQVLLEAARRHRLTRFVHVSTDEVYGSISDGSWTEDHPLLPNSPYAASKAASDLLARSYHRTHGVPVCITRCSNNYGPHQFPEKVIPLFVTNLLNGRNVPLYGTGANARDWLHVDDHCRAVHLVVAGGREGEINNIGGGTELTNRQLTELILDAMNVGSERIDHVADRPGHDLRYSVDCAELGFAPRYDFALGLRETIDWYVENRSWWETARNRQGAP